MKSSHPATVASLMIWAVAAPAVAATSADKPLSRAVIIRALQQENVLEGRRVASVREVCRLKLNRRYYPVVASVERLTGIPEPRLYRHLVVLRSDLSTAYIMPYDFGVQPTRCDRDRVHFAGGTVSVDGQQGSVVQFAHGAVDAWIVEADPQR